MDGLRTEIKFKLVCSRCGKLLECDSDKEKTFIEFGSAYKAGAVIAIRPCENCYAEAMRPIEMIKEALK